MTALGIDFGHRYVGLALAASIRGQETVVTPLKTLRVGKMMDSAREIFNLCLEYEVNLIVIGLPKPRHPGRSLAKAVRKFARQLKSFWPVLDSEARTRRAGKRGLKSPLVVFAGESLTTFQAGEEMKRLGVARRQKPEVENRLAAAFILENFFKSIKSGGSRGDLKKRLGGSAQLPFR